MALEDIPRRVLFVATGAASFPFPFKIFAADQLVVYILVEGGTEEVVSPTEYTVELLDVGGTVTFATAPAAGTRVAIVSAVPYTQPMVLTNRGAFYPETLNTNADLQEAQIQQLVELSERALAVPRTDSRKPEELLNSIFEAQREATEKAAEASSSAELSKAWAQSASSPDNEADSDSPTGKTQSSKSWAMLSKQKAQEAQEAAGSVLYPVSYGVSQSLTDAQKAQARSNIGATSSSDVGTAIAGAAVRYDTAQTLTDAQKQQACTNIGVLGMVKNNKTVLGLNAFDDFLPLKLNHFGYEGLILFSVNTEYINAATYDSTRNRTVINVKDSSNTSICYLCVIDSDFNIISKNQVATPSPNAMDYDPVHDVYILSQWGQEQITLVDPDTYTVTGTLSFPVTVTECCFNSDLNKYICLNIETDNYTKFTIYICNAETLAVESTIEYPQEQLSSDSSLGAFLQDICSVDNYLIMGNMLGIYCFALDGSGMAYTQFNASFELKALWHDGETFHANYHCQGAKPSTEFFFRYDKNAEQINNPLYQQNNYIELKNVNLNNLGAPGRYRVTLDDYSSAYSYGFPYKAEGVLFVEAAGGRSASTNYAARQTFYVSDAMGTSYTRVYSSSSGGWKMWFGKCEAILYSNDLYNLYGTLVNVLNHFAPLNQIYADLYISGWGTPSEYETQGYPRGSATDSTNLYFHLSQNGAIELNYMRSNFQERWVGYRENASTIVWKKVF